MKTITNPLELQSRFLHTEDAPAFGQGKLTASQEQTFIILGHLFPLIIYPLKRNDSPVVAAHAKETLNFCISLFLCLFPLGIVGGLLGTVGAIVVSLVSTVASFGALALVVIAILQGRNGRILRYPLNFRLIK
jgi:uncharacterized protein